jgi:alcohol dehydrogenase class IV
MFTLTNLNYLMPTRLIFGAGTMSKAGEEVAKLGKKALLVTGKKSAEKQGYTQRTVELLKELGVDSIVFNQIDSNPDIITVNRGGGLAKNNNCDVVIGLGGGSALDAAKGIAVVAALSCNIWDVVEGLEIREEVLPLVAIPTTAGTGSEVTPYSVMSNHAIHRKDAFASPYIFPKTAILDPLLTLSLPPLYTASTGMDVLAHAVEAYTSVFANPLSDLFAAEAIRLVGQNLRTAVSNGNNLQARTNMLYANTLAGIAIAQADTTISHVVGEAIGAVYNTDHGTSVALSLPAVMEYNFVSNLEKFANITSWLGEDTGSLTVREAAYRSGAAVRNLVSDVRLPCGYAELGVKLTNEIMNLVTRPGLTASNPRGVSAADFQAIIEKSM